MSEEVNSLKVWRQTGLKKDTEAKEGKRDTKQRGRVDTLIIGGGEKEERS